MTLQEFVEQVFGNVNEETFISYDEEVEIIHWFDGIDHFECHQPGEQSSEYSTVSSDYSTLAVIMAQDIFDLLPDQVEGYTD